MAKDPKLDRLHAVPLFSSCDRKSLEELARVVDSVDVKAGEVLYRQDRRHHEAYVIESGTAEVIIDGETIAEIPEGQMVGEIGLLTKESSTATVVAKTDMTVLVIPYQRFDQILHSTPTLGIDLARELARRLLATDARLH